MPVVGDAELLIRPNASRFGRELQRSVGPQLRQAEQRLGQMNIGKTILGPRGEALKQVGSEVEQTAARIETGLTQAAKRPRKEFTLLGDRATKAVGRIRRAGAAVERQLSGLGISIRDISVVLGAGLAGGVVFALRSVLAFLKESTTAAIEFQEQISALGFTFTSIRPQADAMLRGLNRNLRISKSAAAETLVTFGQVLRNLGETESRALKAAGGLSALARDLSSFADVPFEEASDALRRGLLGSLEALDKLRISLRERQATEEALQLTGKESVEQLTELERIYGRISVIVRQADSAIGDYARTQGSAANQTKDLVSSFDDLQIVIGEQLIPAIREAVPLLRLVILAIDLIATSTRLVVNTISGAVSAFQALGAAARLDFGEAIEQGRESIARFQDSVAASTEFSERFDRALADIADPAGAAARALEETEGRVSDLRTVLQTLPPAAQSAAAALGQLSEEAAFFSSQAQDFIARLDAAAGELASEISDLSPTFGETFRESGSAASGGANRAEDAARRVARAQQDLARETEQAQRAIVDAREDAAFKIRRAEEKLAEEQEEVTERIRRATEDLVQTRLSALQRIIDAEDRFRNRLAEIQRGRDFPEARVGARLTTEELRRVTAAEQALIADRRDVNEGLRRAESDLVENQVDSARDIRRAKEDLARTIDESNDRILKAEERLAELQIRFARRIEDAQRSASRATASAAGEAELTIESLGQSIQQNARDLSGFAEALTALVPRIGEITSELGAAGELSGEISAARLSEAFLAELKELGPEALPLIEALVTASDEELARLIEVFDEQVKASKEAADLQFEKFEGNFEQQIARAIDAMGKEARRMERVFNDIPEQASPAIRKTVEKVGEIVDAINRIRESGKVTFSEFERDLLRAAEQTPNFIEKLELLERVYDGLQDRLDEPLEATLRINVDTEEVLKEIKEGLQNIEDAFDIFPFQGLRGTPTPRQHGGPFERGQPLLVGEKGPELVQFGSSGSVMSNRQLRQLIASAQGTTINISGPSDPLAAARRLEFEMGREGIR